jgi:hypothetical protein
MALVGCSLSSEERVGELYSWVEIVQDMSDDATVQIAQLRESIDETALLLNDEELPADRKEELLEFLDNLQGKLAIAESTKIKADEAVEEWKTEIDRLISGEDEIGVGDELALYGEGVKAIGTSVPPPYGVWVTLGGSIMTILGGLFGSRAQKRYDQKKINIEQTTLTTVVKSVSAALNALEAIEAPGGTAADVAKTAMEVIQKSTESVDVESKVKEIRALPLGS